MPNPVSEAENAKAVTATTTCGTSGGNLLGIFVSSVSGSPSITVSDTTGALIATFTPVAATFYPMPLRFAGTLTVTIAATCSCTVLWGT